MIPPPPRRVALVWVVILASLLATLYVTGARLADPGISTAAQDLKLVSNWHRDGILKDDPQDPSHLPKAGYLVYLRTILPSLGKDISENRVFLYANVVWVIAGVTMAALALTLRSAWAPCGAAFLLFMLCFTPSRDACDYVASEPLAIGVGLLSMGVALLWPTPPCYLVLGVLSGLVAFVRPNLALVLIVIHGLVLASGGRTSTRRLVLPLVAGCVLAIAIAGLLLDRAGASRSLFGGTPRTLLWGTADYYWSWDVEGGWPVGATGDDTASRQTGKAIARWRSFIQSHTNRQRSIAWRLGHALLSAEQLPSRWKAAEYRTVDHRIRQWWWLGGGLLAIGASLAWSGGGGPLRLIPLVLVTTVVAQGLFFGADPRLALPFIPLIAFGLAGSLPHFKWNWRAPTLACVCALMIGAVLVLAPDSASSDFAVVPAGGHTLRQTVRLPRAGAHALRVRILQVPPFAVGLSVYARGETLFTYPGVPSISYPATLRIPLPPSLRAVSSLTITIVTAPTAGPGYLYFPLIPPPLDGYASVDNSTYLDSGYGGQTRGGLPVWVE